MIIEAIAEVVMRVIVGVVFVGIFYWPGWLILRALTFGRYPPKKGEPHSEEFVGIFGFASLLVPVLLTMSGGGP